MTDRLKNLKKDMDDTVLKELDFNEKNKAAVRASFTSNYAQSKKRRFSYMESLVSVCFTILFIGGISYIVLNNLDFTEQENLASNEKIEDSNDPTIAYPERKENFEEMSKEEILQILLNSVDYFETAAGTFETFDSFYDESISKTKVEYKYSNNHVIGGYEKIINYPDKNNPHSERYEHEYYYQDGTSWILDLNENNYVSHRYKVDGKKDKVNAKDVFEIDLYKLYDSNQLFRERPPYSGNLFNYEFVAKYLRNVDQWAIEKQNEKLIGHNTMVIYGEIDESIRESNPLQPGENSYRIWVDKDTGIIIKREVYNTAGDVISYLYTSYLVINEIYESEEFVPNLDNLKKYIPRVSPQTTTEKKEIEVIEHADTISSHVQNVIETQRETIPYFYEFKHTKVTPFSASIEEYEGQQQAYVVYSYDKPDTERGSGSRLLYTRVYPKGSIVRTTGDFERELGEEIDSFSLEGINWRVFEVSEAPNIHLKGEKDGFVYEIVAQEVSLQEIRELLARFTKN